MKVSYEVKGIQSTLKFLNNKNRATQLLSQQALNKAGMFIKYELMESIAGHRAEPTSVDTGKFQNTINTSFTNETAEIYSSLNYPIYLELGTSKLKARHHFENTKNRNKGKVKDFFDKELKQITNK